MITEIFDNTWFMKINHCVSPQATMICFPYGGAGASVFVPWRKCFPEMNIFALKLPGREMRMEDDFITDPAVLIDRIMEILPDRLPAPLIFYGHSMGVGIAYLLMLAIQSKGAKLPDTFIASGREPLHVTHSDPIKDLDPIEVIAYLKKLGGIDGEVSNAPDFLQTYIEKIKADYKLNSRIKTMKPTQLPVRISIANGLEDDTVDMSVMQEWSMYTRYPIDEHCFEGGHFFIRDNFNNFIEYMKSQLNSVIFN